MSYSHRNDNLNLSSTSDPINLLRRAEISRVQQSKAEQSSTQHNIVEQRRADQTVAKKQKNLNTGKNRANTEEVLHPAYIS